ncbi:MAG: exodeoxyribonuclease VII large subunit [Succinivibrio sp.]|nr:exodeoxyribonuclease VII large subunit [Succinivibrio sp.]
MAYKVPNNAPITRQEEECAFSVSTFVSKTDAALGSMGYAVVVGELSQVMFRQHMWFSLKDEQSSVSCLMFKSSVSALPFEPADGLKVVARGYSSVYQKNGQFRFIVQVMKQLGAGDILERLQKLKEQLHREGIFDLHKRPLPEFIDTVGVITSAAGNVVHDIQMTMARRNNGVNIVVYDAKVQGEEAVPSLLAALKQANEEKRCQVLIIGRGGGSLEDLLPFSDESLVRAVAASEIPIISAVGHEPDVALSDFAADIRAATPTAAAEIVTSVTKDAIYNALGNYLNRLDSAIGSFIDNENIRLDRLSARLKAVSPEHQAQLLSARLSRLEQSLFASVLQKISSEKNKVAALSGRLSEQNPVLAVQRGQQRVEQLKVRLDSAIERILNKTESRLNQSLQILTSGQVELQLSKAENTFGTLSARLEALNPLYILNRGYSATLDSSRQTLNIDKASIGDHITTLIKGGRIESEITEISREDPLLKITEEN